MDNEYKVLGVTENATLDEIQAAYRKLQKMYHPSVYQGDRAEAERKITQINEAYSALIKKKNHEKLHEQEIYNTIGIFDENDGPIKYKNAPRENAVNSQEGLTRRLFRHLLY